MAAEDRVTYLSYHIQDAIYQPNEFRLIRFIVRYRGSTILSDAFTILQQRTGHSVTDKILKIPQGSYQNCLLAISGRSFNLVSHKDTYIEDANSRNIESTEDTNMRENQKCFIEEGIEGDGFDEGIASNGSMWLESNNTFVGKSNDDAHFQQVSNLYLRYFIFKLF